MANQVINSEPDVDNNKNIDESRRRFLLASTYALGGLGALCALIPFVGSWFPSAKVQAKNTPVRIDLSHLKPGEQLIVEWRGKPIWIIKRTQQMLRDLKTNTAKLRDPDSITPQQPSYAKNEYRSIDPEYLVLIGICTHLGCSPKYDLSLQGAGGFLCPCHGSTFDLAGRVFKNVPAPINMEVPPYYFTDKHTLVIGEERDLIK